MLNQEQQMTLIDQCQAMTEKVKAVAADLSTANTTIEMQAELLKNSTTTINFLVEFIKKHGIEPPVLPDLPFNQGGSTAYGA